MRNSVLLASLVLIFFGSVHAANNEEDHHITPLYLGLYRGTDITLNTTLREQRKYSPFDKIEMEEKNLPPAKIFSCKKESVSVNFWLLSKHKKKERKQELNEKNRGLGLLYSCDAWSVGIDQMVNSNKGKAEVLSVAWSTPHLEVGPIFLKGNFGYARVSYEVPKYNVTLTDKTSIAYASFGLKAFDRFTINIAPVPRVAGNAYILWLQYRF